MQVSGTLLNVGFVFFRIIRILGENERIVMFVMP